MDKKSNVLCIVESPNKCATITKIFKDAGYSNIKVMASAGHITEIKNGGPYWNTGVDPSKDFEIDYTISPSKKKIVSELKEAVSRADKVILCSDPDREGEAISWHLKKQLKITDAKYQRVTFHEITKAAILKALDAPRKIDNNLVEAAKGRQAADIMLGFRVSPIARDSLNCKSVGRCQSAGLKLVCDRENEILNFKPEKFYDLYLSFIKNKTNFKAKYIGTAEKEIKRISTLEKCEEIKKLCTGGPYTVKDILNKDQKENPKPPFTTSTFQQEANRVYGVSIDTAMNCAQKLFEGISIKGEHIALITYIRTDDSSMSPEFAENLALYVKANYGKEYYAPVKKGTKSESAQEAHECLRVVNLNMTPGDLSKLISDQLLLKIYKLIWERTVTSSMAAAIISDTAYTIENNKQLFVMHSREIKFDGYRKIHVDTEDEIGKDEIVKETFAIGEELKNTKLQEEYKETTPPKRYSEATIVREMEKRGIGRPSTFATIVKTILAEDRGYCKLESKLIAPTNKGMELSKFLDKYFPDLINLNYTKEMEEDLDLIACGKKKRVAFLNEFYNKLETAAKKVEPEVNYCPECGKILIARHSKYGRFWGCSGYPTCKYTKK